MKKQLLFCTMLLSVVSLQGKYTNSDVTQPLRSYLKKHPGKSGGYWTITGLIKDRYQKPYQDILKRNHKKMMSALAQRPYNKNHLKSVQSEMQTIINQLQKKLKNHRYQNNSIDKDITQYKSQLNSAKQKKNKNQIKKYKLGYHGLKKLRSYNQKLQLEAKKKQDMVSKYLKSN